MKHLLPTIALGAVMLVAAGCSGGPTVQSTGNGPGATTGVSPAATVAVGSTPSAAAPTSAPGAPSVPAPTVSAGGSEHADPGLEAMLPASVSGTAMQRSSATFAALLDAGGDRTAIDAFLQGIGKSEADGTYAAAFDPTNALAGGIFAFKVTGADAGALLAGIVAVEGSDLGDNPTAHQATVGGKNVTVVSVGTGVNDTEWIFGRGDVVFVVHASDETLAAAYLQAIQ